MNKSSVSVEDFVLDPDFRKWILHDDSESNIRWEKFLNENPAYREDILIARRIILYLEQKQLQPDQLEDFDKADIWFKIKAGVAQKDATGEAGALVIPISSEVILNKQKEKKNLRFSFLKYVAILLLSA